MNEQHDQNGHKIIFSENNFKNINNLLVDFIKKSRAKLCVFADMNGYPVSYYGQTKGINISTLTALAAGDFSATAEMAKIIEQNNKFRYIYHEGVKNNLYLCTIAEDYIMIVLFDRKVALGMIRILANDTIKKFDALLDEIKHQNRKETEFIDMEFRNLFRKQLEKTFRKK